MLAMASIKADVRRHVNHAQFRRDQHHRHFRRAGQMREHFGVAGKFVAGGMQRFLVQRRGADRLRLARLRQLDGALDVVIRRFARDGRELAERQIVGNQLEVDAFDTCPGVKRASAGIVEASTSRRLPTSCAGGAQARRIADHERLAERVRPPAAPAPS